MRATFAFALFLTSISAFAQQAPAPYEPTKVTFSVPYSTWENIKQDDAQEEATKSIGFGGTLWFEPFKRALGESDNAAARVLSRALVGVGFNINRGAGSYFNNFEYNQEIRTSYDDSRCSGTQYTGEYHIDPYTGERVDHYEDTWGECFQCSDNNGICYNRAVHSRINRITYSPGSIDIEAEIPFNLGDKVTLAGGAGWVGSILKTGDIDNDLRTNFRNSMVLSASARYNFNERASVGISFKEGVMGTQVRRIRSDLTLGWK